MKARLTKSDINGAKYYGRLYAGRIIGASIYRDRFNAVSKFGASTGYTHRLALMLADGAIVDIASGTVEQMRAYGEIATNQ